MADSISTEAVEFVQQVSETDSDNRTRGLEDLRFRFGEQWPADIVTARGARPRLTVNETDAYCRQIENALREQRPRIKAYAANTLAQKKTAEIITGLLRHFQVNSDADNAYDLAGAFAVTMGVGYWRVLYDYVREDSFDQDIFIRQIENPFSVYFDTNSNEPDGSDAEKALITDKLPIEVFKREFPDAQFDNFTATAAGDSMSDWVSKDDIRIAEFFRVTRVRAKLVALSNGLAVWDDQMQNAQFAAALQAQGITVKGDRPSYKRKVTWHKVTAAEELENKDWAGRWIPIVPTYGSVMVIDGKRERMGAVRFARDPQTMVNYWQTAISETMAMMPKAKWLVEEGSIEGYENIWSRANLDATAYLPYKRTNLAGQEAFKPERVAPEPPPEGLIVAAGQASVNLQKVMGMFDPETNSTSPKSGKAIRAESQQSERSNYHFYDNQTRSMKHTGRICIDLVRHIMDVYRVACIIGEDGKPDLVEINKPQQAQQPQIDPAEGQAIAQVLNDVRVGEYGVIMDVGPGFNSKRQEAAEALGQILAADHELMSVIGDLYFRNLDFPGAEVIADRLASQNPLAQIDEKSDVPPQAQMAIKALQQKLQAATQQLQALGTELKFGLQKEQIREDGELKREMLRQTTKAHDIETNDATKRHDVETRAVTSQNVEEIKGIVALLVKHIDTSQLEREIAARNEEQARQAAEAEAATTPA